MKKQIDIHRTQEGIGHSHQRVGQVKGEQKEKKLRSKDNPCLHYITKPEQDGV
jgi:hypothetical protein